MLQNRCLDVELGTPYMVHPKYCILIKEVGLEKKLNNYRAVQHHWIFTATGWQHCKYLTNVEHRTAIEHRKYSNVNSKASLKFDSARLGIINSVIYCDALNYIYHVKFLYNETFALYRNVTMNYIDRYEIICNGNHTHVIQKNQRILC